MYYYRKIPALFASCLPSVSDVHQSLITRPSKNFLEESLRERWSLRKRDHRKSVLNSKTKGKGLTHFFCCLNTRLWSGWTLSPQRANMAGSGSAHLLTPFEALSNVRFSFRICRSTLRVYKPFSSQSRLLLRAFSLLIRVEAQESEARINLNIAVSLVWLIFSFILFAVFFFTY